MDSNEVICHCAGITLKEIKDAINEGYNTVELIQEHTDAGISCGYCIEVIEELLKI